MEVCKTGSQDQTLYTLDDDNALCTLATAGPILSTQTGTTVYMQSAAASIICPEPNPGPRPPKFSCGSCHRKRPGVGCDSCDVWYHHKCMGMSNTMQWVGRCHLVMLLVRNAEFKEWHIRTFDRTYAEYL
jgi:hypothetical protein